jgi:broad specificity phosphatase PhoE
MTTCYFLRHGSFNRLGNNLDPPLTQKGTAEAKATAAWLADKFVDSVYASPLTRASQTAAIIAAPQALPVIQDARLRERASFGDLPEQTVEEFVSMWERCNVERTWIPPTGDSSRACGARVEDFVANRNAGQPNATIVAASHGGAIADFLLYAFTVDEIAAINPALAATPFNGDVIRECSITFVHFDGTAYTLEQVASINHLLS